MALERMSGEKDFQRRLDTIERGIHALEAANDPGLRATVQQLVQAILELHEHGLTRLLDIVHASGASGPAIIDRLGRDPLVGKLLLLHSLHPFTIEERVTEALDSLRPALLTRHADVELLSIDANGAVRVRVIGGEEQKADVERAILEAAPDATAIDIEGPDHVVGFIPLGTLRAKEAALATPTPPRA
jgi:hypothetical protein